ncbi:MAG: hypothetical protein MI922_27165, partial [Bacteroidales bacterium]|nr:hypothetical protein [Bacteroidales bacterium]
SRLAQIQGVTLMLSDVNIDTVKDYLHGGLKDDARKEKKIFRYGGNTNRLEGILRNLVGGIKFRLSWTINEKVLFSILSSLESLIDQGTNEQLWSYIVRYLIQPQLMVPRMIPHAMQGMKVDGPITSIKLERLKAKNIKHEQGLRDLGVGFLGKPTVDELTTPSFAYQVTENDYKNAFLNASDKSIGPGNIDDGYDSEDLFEP